MVYEIEADVVLANVLLFDRRPVGLGQLKSIRNLIESKIYEVRLDVTRDSVILATEYCRDMFRWKDGVVTRRDGSEAHFFEDYVYRRFNQKIPSELRQRVVEAFREVCAK